MGSPSTGGVALTTAIASDPIPTYTSPTLTYASNNRFAVFVGPGGIQATGTLGTLSMALLGAKRAVHASGTLAPGGTALLNRQTVLRATGSPLVTGIVNTSGPKPVAASGTPLVLAHANLGRKAALKAAGVPAPQGIAAFGNFRFLGASGSPALSGAVVSLFLKRTLQATGAPGVNGTAQAAYLALRVAGSPLSSGTALLGRFASLQAFNQPRVTGTAVLGYYNLHAQGSITPTGTALVRSKGSALKALGTVVPIGTVHPSTFVLRSVASTATVAVPLGSDFSVTGILTTRGPLYAGFYPSGTVQVQGVNPTTGNQVWLKSSPHRDLILPPHGAGEVAISLRAADLPQTRGGALKVNVTAVDPTSVLTWTVGTFLVQVV